MEFLNLIFYFITRNLIFLEDNFTKIPYHNTWSRDCLLICYDTFFVFYKSFLWWVWSSDLPFCLSLPSLFSCLIFVIFSKFFFFFRHPPLKKNFFFSYLTLKIFFFHHSPLKKKFFFVTPLKKKFFFDFILLFPLFFFF